GTRQRARRDHRRDRARHRRKLRLLLVRAGARNHDLFRYPTASAVRSPTRPRRQARLRMRSWIALVVVTALMAALPLAGNNYLLRLATITCMYAVLAQSWNFIGGLAGYPSFATAAFFGLGGYGSAILAGRGLPAVAAWGCGGLVGMVGAAFIGGGILHLRGHYFAIAALVGAEMLREIVNTTPHFTGGGMGLKLPIMRMSVGAQAQVFFFSMLGLGFLCTATSVLVQTSQLRFRFRLH